MYTTYSAFSQKLALYLSLPCLCLSLSGCLNAPKQHFGVDEQVWYTLTPAQQNYAMESYHQRQYEQQLAAQRQQEVEAQNAPLNALIGLGKTALSMHSAKKASTTIPSNNGIFSLPLKNKQHSHSNTQSHHQDIYNDAGDIVGQQSSSSMESHSGNSSFSFSGF